MSKRRVVSDEDAALFRDAACGARPLGEEHARPHRRNARPVARGGKSSLAPAGNETEPGKTFRNADRDGEQLFVRPGLQKKHLRRLRRGQIPIDAETDLHGMRIHEAHTLLADFLRECRNEGARCVRVIHGKGLGSRGGQAVLKWEVDRWLRQHDGVMAFCTAQPRDGGTGAVYVLLRG